MPEPNPPNPGSPDAPKADVTPGAGGTGGKEGSDAANATDPALAFLNKTLNRDFKNLDEAGKTIAGLNSLVGDRALSELRQAAKLGESFKKITEGYAKEHGMGYDEAQAELLQLSMDDKSQEPGKEKSPGEVANAKVIEEVASLRERLDREDLIKKHPEAAHVIADLAVLAKAGGKSLAEVFEASETLKVAAKSIADSRDRAAKGAVMDPSGKLGTGGNKAIADAAEALKGSRNRRNEEGLVSAVLGVK